MHVIYSVLSYIDDVLLIKPFANVHHKDWLIYSGETDSPGELYYNFSLSNDLTQIVNFSSLIPDYDSYGPTLLDLFISSVFKYLFCIGFLSSGKF